MRLESKKGNSYPRCDDPVVVAVEEVDVLLQDRPVVGAAAHNCTTHIVAHVGAQPEHARPLYAHRKCRSLRNWRMISALTNRLSHAAQSMQLVLRRRT